MSELRQTLQLEVRECCLNEYCSGDRVRSRPFTTGWDTVLPELRVGSLRPDIVLLQDGKPLAAIEVHATHEVPPEKVEALEALGMPWIEVTADERLYAADTAWRAGSPLPIEKICPGPAWECDVCRRQRLRREEREKKARERAEREQRMRLRATRVYDMYRTNGHYVRIKLRSEWEVPRNGTIASVRIRRADKPKPLFESAVSDSLSQVNRAANDRLIQWGKSWSKHGWHVDQPQRWQKRTKGEKAIQPPQPRYVWDAQHGWLPRNEDVPELPRSFRVAVRREFARREAEAAEQQRHHQEILEAARREALTRIAARQSSHIESGGAPDPVYRSRMLIDLYNATSPDHVRRSLVREIIAVRERPDWFEGFITWYPNPQPLVSVCSLSPEECARSLEEALVDLIAYEAFAGLIYDSPGEGTWREVGQSHLNWSAPLRFQWEGNGWVLPS